MSMWDMKLPEDLKNNAMFVAVLSDRVECGRVQQGMLHAANGITDASRILEIRVFTEEKEYRAFREALADDFQYRLLDDTGKKLTPYDVYDEEQFLDIKSCKMLDNGFTCFTTEGGGEFRLPTDERITKVTVRTYLSEDPRTGLSCAGDWRIVKFA